MIEGRPSASNPPRSGLTGLRGTHSVLHVRPSTYSAVQCSTVARLVRAGKPSALRGRLHPFPTFISGVGSNSDCDVFLARLALALSSHAVCVICPSHSCDPGVGAVVLVLRTWLFCPGSGPRGLLCQQHHSSTSSDFRTERILNRPHLLLLCCPETSVYFLHLSVSLPLPALVISQVNHLHCVGRAIIIYINDLQFFLLYIHPYTHTDIHSQLFEWCYRTGLDI